MEHIFIVNPIAGQEDSARKMVPYIHEAAANCGITAITEVTKAPLHAAQIARKYSETGRPVRLYAVGGDGTLNELFSGAYQHKNAEVASVPCGSGNDFVRTFGEVNQFLDIEDQIKGQAVDIDLMQVNDGVSAAITSTGLDAEVAYNIPKYRRFPMLGGTMAYNISIIERVLKPLGKELRVTIDGEVAEEDNFLIATVCNGKTYGGGYIAAPMADVQDGTLEVILVKKVSRLKIAAIIGKYKNGRHIKNGKVDPRYNKVIKYYRAKEVKIEPIGDEPFILNVDGECGPDNILDVKVLPQSARFVLPASMYTKFDNKY